MVDAWAVLGVVAPIVVSTVVLLAFIRRARGANGAGFGGAAVAAGFVAGALFLLGPRFAPRESHHWTIHLGLAALVAGALRGRGPWLVHAALRLVLALAASFLTLYSVLLQNELENRPGTAAALCVGLAAVAWVVGAALDRAAEDPSPGVPAAFVALGTASAVALVAGRSALLGQLGGAVAAASGPLLVAAWLRPGSSVSRGAVPLLGTVLPALWIGGAYFANLPRSSGGLLAGAAVATLAGDLPWVRDRKPWIRSVARVLGVVALGGVAVALAATSGGYEARSSEGY